MKRSLKTLVVSITITMITLGTAVPAFADPPGQAVGAPDFGLFLAVTNINDNVIIDDDNALGENLDWGTHNAACNGVGAKNPALGAGLKEPLAFDCLFLNPPERPGGP